MKLMGYKRGDDDKWEETTRYIERQSGIFAVWGAMGTHQLNPKTLTNDNNPFPLAYAWRWIARALNHRATGDVECALMATFLEVVNEALLKRYGRQAQKIVRLAVGGEWSNGLRGPAAGRLEIMREEFGRTGRVGEDGFGSFVP
jgi:nucleoporin GLE1